MGNPLTASQYATETGKTWGSASKALKRAGLPSTQNAPLADAVKAVIDRVKAPGQKTADKKPTVKKSLTVENAAVVLSGGWPLTLSEQTKTDKDKANGQNENTDKTGQQTKQTGWTKFYFFLVVLVPTLVSVGNIYNVSLSIMRGNVEAYLLTAVLSAMGPFLLWLDARSKTVFCLALALIGFEAFANTVRIYYGLMGSGGNPVQFVGTVCDIFFSSGTHGTALGLSFITALIIAAVQYVGVNGMKK